MKILGSSPGWGYFLNAPLAKWIPRHPPKYFSSFSLRRFCYVMHVYYDHFYFNIASITKRFRMSKDAYD